MSRMPIYALGLIPSRFSNCFASKVKIMGWSDGWIIPSARIGMRRDMQEIVLVDSKEGKEPMSVFLRMSRFV
jgi:hypothetical protein